MNAFSNKLRATLHKSPDIKAFITHIIDSVSFWKM